MAGKHERAGKETGGSSKARAGRHAARAKDAEEELPKKDGSAKGASRGGAAAKKKAEEPIIPGYRPKPKAPRRPLVLVAVIIVSIIMVGSILLPSLSSIVSGMKATASDTSATTAAQTAPETSPSTDAAATGDAATAAATTNTQLEYVNSQYSPSVAALEEKLKGSPDDPAILINLANDYYNWAGQAMQVASTEDERAQVTANFTKAKGYYDQYLQHESSNSARANSAMCAYYAGDAETAVTQLQQLTAEAADFSPAWAYLGMIYQANGYATDATDAYHKALDTDPDNKYGMQSTITSQLQTLEAATTDAAATTAASE